MAFLSRRQRVATPTRQPRSETSAGGVLFQRSRTLTGSLSSEVHAASEARSQLRSPRLKEHDLRRYRRKIAWGIGGLLAGAAVLVGLLDQLIVTPRVIFQPSVTTVSAARYDAIVASYFAARPFERFGFALNSDAFSDYVVQVAPELVSAVIVHDNGFAAYRATLAPRKPLARWQIDDKVFFVDSSGLSFEHNLLAAPALSVKDESGLPPASQQIVASTKMMRFIGQVVGEVTRQLAPVQEIIIPPGTLKEVDIVVAGHPYRVKLSVDRDAVGQAADVVNAIKHLDSKQVMPQYLDVRVEGKGFYLEG